MSTEVNQDEMGPSKPVAEHEWLKNLIGTWKVDSEMMMPDGSQARTTGHETTTDYGPLWIFGEGESEMPDGHRMRYKVALGYDLTFKEYRGFMLMDVSSHLWKYEGTLSGDGKVMTLEGEGPNMMGEGTAKYRDVIEILDEDHRTLTSAGETPGGEWVTFMKATYTRVG